jgi:hypothetical protein
MLYEICQALSAAKGSTSAFGGINIIFAGDFAQLPPVGKTRLYSHLDKKSIAKASTKDGQKIIFGKLLWLSVTHWTCLLGCMKEHALTRIMQLSIAVFFKTLT